MCEMTNVFILGASNRWFAWSPSSSNSLYRIRMILLGKNPVKIENHTNVPIEEENEVVRKRISEHHANVYLIRIYIIS